MIGVADPIKGSTAEASGALHEGGIRIVMVTGDNRTTADAVARKLNAITRPASACCGADEPVEEARRKLYQHRATSFPIVDKAGGCCGTVSVHGLERS